MSRVLAVIVVGSLLFSGCRSLDAESNDGRPTTEPQVPLPAYEPPPPHSSEMIASKPSQVGEYTAVIARGRRVLVMDQSVSMVGFSKSGSLRRVEDAVALSFKGVVGHEEAVPWQFFGVAEQLKPAKPPLANASRLTGKATNLEAAIDLLAQPDVALGILVTDGLPSGSDAGKRPCYDLTLPSVEPFAKAFSETLAAESGLWIVLARLPFEGNSYLNCSEIAGHLLPRLQKAFGGMKPKCIGATRGGCRCGGECKVRYEGMKPILLVVVTQRQLVEKTRVGVTMLVRELQGIEGSDAVAMELYPGTPDSWVLDGDVYSHRLDLRNVGGTVRSTPMTEEPKRSGRWFGKNVCIEGEDSEVVVEICAKRVPSPVAMLHSLEISQPEIRFETPGVHTDANRGFSTRTLAPGREFLVWDQGMIYPMEPGLVRASEIASCQDLFEKVKRHPEWCRPVPNAVKSEWCRQVIVSCGCLEQEGKMGPGQVARVVMDLYYTVTTGDDRVPEEIASYSIEREPYLHPDKIYGLTNFVRGVLQLVARRQQSLAEHRFGHVELTIGRP